MNLNRTINLPRCKMLCSLMVVGLMSGCGAGSSGGSSSDFDLTGMLADMADNLIIPGYQDLTTTTAALASRDGALASYCSAIDSNAEATQLMAAQQAWKTAMDQWQTVEAHRIGPITDNSEDLATRISSASLSDCGIGRAVVLAQEDGFDISTRSLDQRGLEAVEYLLFEDELDLTCPSQFTELEGWNDRTDVERKQWRCDYALLAADNIAEAAAAVSTAWEIEGGNYRSQFLNPSNVAATLEAVSDAIVIFIDQTVKDGKLGFPLGIADDCSDRSCPDGVESPYAEYSLTNIRHNMAQFIQVLNHDGLSLADLIADAGVPDLATDLQANAQAAIDLIDTMDSSLLAQATAIDSDDAVAACTNAYNNPETDSEQSACQLYGLVKKVSDDLKVGFVAAVDVDLPDRAQSDND